MACLNESLSCFIVRLFKLEATDNTITADMALKEWAVVVEIMGSGRQILTLRKGGIHPSDKNFRVLHKEFLLYPTYEHQ